MESSKKNKLDNLAIQQNAVTRDRIIFGKLVGRFVGDGIMCKREGYSSSRRLPELQECLNSTNPISNRFYQDAIKVDPSII